MPHRIAILSLAVALLVGCLLVLWPAAESAPPLSAADRAVDTAGRRGEGPSTIPTKNRAGAIESVAYPAEDGDQGKRPAPTTALRGITCLFGSKIPEPHVKVTATFRPLAAQSGGSAREGSAFELQFQSDAEGRFAVEGLPPLFSVRLVSQGEHEGLGDQLFLADPHDPEALQDLRFEIWPEFARHGPFHGTVKDPEGRPLGGLTIQLEKTQSDDTGYSFNPQVITRFDGSFVSYCPRPGRYRLKVPSGAVVGESEFDYPRTSESPLHFVATTRHNALLTGSFVDELGAGIADEPISAYSAQTKKSYHATSDQEGRWLIRAESELDGTEVRFALNLKGKSILEGPQRASFGGDPVQFRLASFPLLRIHGFDAITGNALPMDQVARVAGPVDGIEGPPPSRVPGGMRMRPGRFHLVLGPLHRSDAYPIQAPIPVEMGQDSQEITVQMRRPESRLIRIARGSETTFEFNNLIQLLPLDPREEPDLSKIAMASQEHLSENGRQSLIQIDNQAIDERSEVRLKGDPNARYVLLLRSSDRNTIGDQIIRDVRIANDESPLEINLNFDGVLKGQLVGKMAQRGLSTFSLVSSRDQAAEFANTLHAAGGINRTISVADDGRFVVNDLPPGSYDLLMTVTPAPPQLIARSLRIRGRGLADQVVIDVDAFRPTSVHVMARVGGKPAKAQQIVAIKKEGLELRSIQKEWMKPTTEGNKAHFQLPAGEYRFAFLHRQVSRGEEASMLLLSEIIALKPGDDLQREFAFEDRPLIFECVDSDSLRPLRQELVRISLAAGVEEIFRTDDLGQIRIRYGQSLPMRLWLHPLEEGLATEVTPGAQSPVMVRLRSR